MIVTGHHLRYGFGKCPKCEGVLPLEQFRQWVEREETHRSRKCVRCEKKVPLHETGSGPSPIHLGHAYWENCEIIRRAKAVPCADCNRLFPAVCMDFDHRESSLKAHNIGGLKSRRQDILLAEIAKCDVVCACCHRLRTQNRGYANTGRRAHILR